MCPGSVNRDTAVFQSVEKDEATQAIICTILSASNTSLWRLLLKGFFTEEQEGGERERERDVKNWKTTWAGEEEREETLLYGVRRFFPGGLWDSRGGGGEGGRRSSNDSVFACAHGDCECLRLDACAGFMERMDGACIVELRVNDTERVAFVRGEVFLLAGGYLWSH